MLTAVARSASGGGDRGGAVGIAVGAGGGGASVSGGAGLAGRLGGYAGIIGRIYRCPRLFQKEQVGVDRSKADVCRKMNFNN